MDRTGEDLAFSQDSETITEVSHIVFSLNFISELRFMVLGVTKMAERSTIRNEKLKLLLT